MMNVEYINRTLVSGTRLSRAIRHSAFGIFLGIFCLLFPVKSFGQSSNRWLIIFNTSSTMRDRVDGVKDLTQNLLTTAMHGNLRSGDTIGIWTYDSELRADEAPLLTWNPNAAQSIAQHALGFVTHHRYQKTAAFADVQTNMLRVIENSDVITVILVSDGTDAIQGTPYDAEINAFYKANSRGQKKVHMPVVTVFRGLRGNFVANTVSLPPSLVGIPPVPPPEIAKVIPKPPEAPKPPPPVVPSLIMIGKKAEAPAQVLAETAAAAPKAEPSASPELVPGPKVIPEKKPEPTTSATPSPAATPPGAPIAETPKPPAEPPVTNMPSANEASAKPSPPSTQPAVETEATVPSSSPFSARNLAIISSTFAVIVCGLLILTARRARRQSQTSLITRSLDREQ